MAVAGNERAQNVEPRLGGPTMKPNFNWEAGDTYYKLKNFRLEVNNIFKSYNTPQAGSVSNYKKLARQKGLQFIESLTERERCNTTEGLFTTFNNKIKPLFNETIKSLQFHKLSRQAKENAKEWMGRLRLAVVQCNYREVDRQLKEKFLHGLNAINMVTEMIR